MSDVSIKGLSRLLSDMIGDDDRPLAVFSATWPLARALKMPGESLSLALLDMIETLGASRRLLAMPTFIGGYRDGFADLDAEPSTTGVLTERFRLNGTSRRTVSAFFPFSVAGPDAAQVVALRPPSAWGEGSIYHWLEQTDAIFLMLGCHPTHCSYLHRLEEMLSDKVSYRYFKPFKGRVRHEGEIFELAESLFVRSLSPEAINDLTVLTPLLTAGGMRATSFGGAPISVMSAHAMRDACLPALIDDPLLLLKNRADFEKKS